MAPDGSSFQVTDLGQSDIGYTGRFSTDMLMAGALLYRRRHLFWLCADADGVHYLQDRFCPSSPVKR